MGPGFVVRAYDAKTLQRSRRIHAAQKIFSPQRILWRGPIVFLPSGAGMRRKGLIMKRIVVRYKVKPEQVAENERLIAQVFEEMREKAPQGVRYMALKLGDGSFVHFSVAQSDEAPAPLLGIAAFQTFQSKIRERCVEPPLVSEATIIGDYRMLSER
jgi:hypothetical protein